MPRKIALLFACAFVAIIAFRSTPQTFAADTVSKWNGYEQRNFVVDGRNALLVFPTQPATGKPWIWRTEFFGHEPQGDLALLAHGFHVAYLDVQNMYGAPVALDHMDKFYEHVVDKFGLSKKVVLEGFSRGGLFSLNWAARNPDKVACIYNDAPVCDFKSWPGGKGHGQGSPGDWQNCLKVYSLTEPQALAYKLNPVDNLAPLANAKIPLLHICGDADDVVPIPENTLLVEDRYRKLGAPITVIVKPGCGHHPHSLPDPAPIVAFVLKYTIGADKPFLSLDGVSDYQVFQRTSTADGTIRLHGLAISSRGELQYQLQWADVGGEQPHSWRTIPVDPLSNRFDFQARVWQGGWSRLELRIANHGNTLAEHVVKHVGVGEVFVVAGQSNAANHGSEKQKPKSRWVAAFDGAKWQLANDPQPIATGDGGSFMPAFGDAMFAKYHVPIGIVPVAVGATSVREWLPKGDRMTNEPTTGAHVKAVGKHEWESTGELFDRLAARLHTLGPHGCRAILWHQGESDAGQARGGAPADRQITADQYRGYLEKLIRASQKAAGWDVPWFVAQVTYHSESDAADEEFRNAQKSLWTTGIALEGPDTDALRGDYRAGVHFNGKGLQVHGQAWADKVGVWLDKELKTAR